MNQKHQKGFSLVEVIVAVFILEVGLLASMSLLTSTFGSFQLSQKQFVAANLAQEGIEKVRNKRDSNWVSRRDTWQGISGGSFDSASEEIPLNNKDYNREVSIQACETVAPPGCRKIVSQVQLDGEDEVISKIEARLYDWYPN